MKALILSFIVLGGIAAIAATFIRGDENLASAQTAQSTSIKQTGRSPFSLSKRISSW